MDLNKVMIIGRLTKNPEGRATPTGQSVCSFSVATNRVYTDAQGQKQDKAEFHNIVAWGKLADICTQYLTKGKRAYIEGRLQTRDWVGQDGVRRYSTEVIAENMIMLDGPSGSGGGGMRDTSPSHDSAPLSQGSCPSDEDRTIEEIPF
ncbi:MAG: single-stranded DNA-binding protein [Candidatus Uhrbacteria bacterium]|nr:single-stranded DNA-binding protein [Candidatus Uhrbacteria bacterium]